VRREHLKNIIQSASQVEIEKDMWRIRQYGREGKEEINLARA
jgi:hypothetical protein